MTNITMTADTQIGKEWMDRAQALSTPLPDFAYDIIVKAHRFTLTTKQINAVRRAIERTERIEADREAKKDLPPIEGRLTVTGEVLKTKWKYSSFGARPVMTMKLPDGNVVHGTVPKALVDFNPRYQMDPEGMPEDSDLPQTGDEVTLTATFKPIDAGFSVYQRPHAPAA